MLPEGGSGEGASTTDRPLTHRLEVAGRDGAVERVQVSWATNQRVLQRFRRLPTGRGIGVDNLQARDRVLERRQGAGRHIALRATAASIPDPDLAPGRRDGGQRAGGVARLCVGSIKKDGRREGDGTRQAVDQVDVEVRAEVREVLHLMPDLEGLAAEGDRPRAVDDLARACLDAHDQIQVRAGGRHDRRPPHADRKPR